MDQAKGKMPELAEKYLINNYSRIECEGLQRDQTGWMLSTPRSGWALERSFTPNMVMTRR